MSTDPISDLFIPSHEISAVQGLGGGGVATVTQIIVADLVPLNERGLYQGYIGLVYSLAAGIGPITVRYTRAISNLQS